MNFRVGGQGQVQAVLNANGLQFIKELFSLDDCKKVIVRGKALPVGEQPEVLHKPHGRGHAVTLQALQGLDGKRRLGLRQNKIGLEGFHLGENRLGNDLKV
jgi:hypothetical protein